MTKAGLPEFFFMCAIRRETTNKSVNRETIPCVHVIGNLSDIAWEIFVSKVLKIALCYNTRYFFFFLYFRDLNPQTFGRWDHSQQITRTVGQHVTIFVILKKFSCKLKMLLVIGYEFQFLFCNFGNPDYIAK